MVSEWIPLRDGELRGPENGGETHDVPVRVLGKKAYIFRVTYTHKQYLAARVISYTGPAGDGQFWYKDSVLVRGGQVTHYLLAWRTWQKEEWSVSVTSVAARLAPSVVGYAIDYVEYDADGFVFGYDEERQYPGPPGYLGWLEFPEGGELVLTHHTPFDRPVTVEVAASRPIGGAPTTIFQARIDLKPGETGTISIPKSIVGDFYVTVKRQAEDASPLAGFVVVTHRAAVPPAPPPEQPPEKPPEKPPELPTSPWDALKDLLRRVLRDLEPVRIDPVVTKGLIAVMFTILTYTIANLSQYAALFGLVPRLVFTESHRLLTNMWLHASWEHYIGNMLFLYVFGDNVEERLGYLRYLLFYLAAGIVAGLGWVMYAAVVPGLLDTPAIGASGAISGVMGAYAVFFPRARVVVVEKEVPAQAFLALWFLSQFALAFQITAVAWMAHVVGFVFGVGVGYLVSRLERGEEAA